MPCAPSVRNHGHMYGVGGVVAWAVEALPATSPAAANATGAAAAAIRARSTRGSFLLGRAGRGGVPEPRDAHSDGLKVAKRRQDENTLRRTENYVFHLQESRDAKGPEPTMAPRRA